MQQVEIDHEMLFNQLKMNLNQIEDNMINSWVPLSGESSTEVSGYDKNAIATFNQKID